MSLPVSDFDAGHLHLAALMHRLGMDRLELSMDELEAVTAHFRDTGLQMVVMETDAGSTIEFLSEAMCDGLAADGSAEPGTTLN